MVSEADTKQRPAFWVPSLYVAEGLPFVATMLVSVQMYKSLGLTDTEIAAFTSLVAWPWSLKPLWSPFMESVPRRRSSSSWRRSSCGGPSSAAWRSLLSTRLPSSSYSLAFFALLAFTPRPTTSLPTVSTSNVCPSDTRPGNSWDGRAPLEPRAESWRWVPLWFAGLLEKYCRRETRVDDRDGHVRWDAGLVRPLPRPGATDRASKARACAPPKTSQRVG